MELFCKNIWRLKSINYFCGKTWSYVFDLVLNTPQNTKRKGQILQKENFGELTTKISRKKNEIIVIDFNKKKLYQKVLPYL